jgi:peptide deformylase
LLVIQAGDPVLRRVADELTLEQVGSAETAALIEDLRVSLAEKPGVGIAAPQIGVSLRVVIVQDPAGYQLGMAPERLAELERVPVEQYVLINPVLELIGTETRTFFEGCLSVDGYRALVRRSYRVRVRYLDPEGNGHDEIVSGWHARILQHEVDHLNGTLYIDRMASRTFMNDEHYEYWAHEPPEVVGRTFGVVDT